MRHNDLHEPVVGDGPSMSIPVGPVAPDRRLPTLPWLVAVAVVVGAIAFLAGLQVGSGSNSTTTPVASPSAGPTASGIQSATASPVAVVPGSSEFARTFRPLEVVAGVPDGSKCVGKGVGQNQQAGPDIDPSQTFVSVWMTFCPLSAAHRDAFVKKVVEDLANVMPTHGYGYSSNDQGQIFAVFPYQQTSFVGTVTMAAIERGTGLEISITLEERAGR